MSEKQFPAGKIRFEIESLGPMRDSVVDFKPFLLFSGESNTGKSYTAMVVFYLFFMLDNKKIISELTHRVFDIKKIENDLKNEKEVEIKLPDGLMNELERMYNENIARFMAYMLGYDDFSCRVKVKLDIQGISDGKIYISLPKRSNGEHDIKIKARFANLDWDHSTGMSKNHDVNIEDEMIDWVHLLYKRLVFDEKFLKKFLLPPARGAFSGLAPSMWKKFSGIGMYNEFQEGIDSVRFSSFDPDEELEEQRKFVNPLFAKLLSGKIKVEKDNISYRVAGSNEDVPLTAGSSSVKELFPLYLLLNRVPIDDLSICIEEPEAHLHPELQRSVALLLAYIVNHGGLVQVTTHSDFFVNQINNLLKLHFLKNKDRDVFLKALKETGIQEAFVLNPEDLGAFYFEMVNSKGTVRARKLEVSEKGMPLESFKQAYDQSVKETRNLREALTDELERETGR